MIQIGARNMQNYTLLAEVGRSGCPVLLKRGFSSTLEELLMAAEYVLKEGNEAVMLCERGIRTFETAYRFTLDLMAVPVLKELSHLPVIVDPSHAAGRRDLVMPLSLAAAAAGADGIIVEVHPHPETAICDGPAAALRGRLRRLRGARAGRRGGRRESARRRLGLFEDRARRRRADRRLDRARRARATRRVGRGLRLERRRARAGRRAGRDRSRLCERRRRGRRRRGGVRGRPGGDACRTRSTRCSRPRPRTAWSRTSGRPSGRSSPRSRTRDSSAAIRSPAPRRPASGMRARTCSRAPPGT